MKATQSIATSAMMLALLAGDGFGQVYNTTNAYLTPQVVQAPLAFTPLSVPVITTPFALNSIGIYYFLVAGTFTGFSANVQVAQYLNGGTTSWANATAESITSSHFTVDNITADGLYRVIVDGAQAVRLSVNALSSGTAFVTQIAGAYPLRIEAINELHASYSNSIIGFTPAASPTDFFSISGSATRKIVIQKVTCNGTSNSANTTRIVGVKRSSIDSDGTDVTPNTILLDSQIPSPTAIVRSYSANPATLGTIVGAPGYGWELQLNNKNSGTFPLEWDFYALTGAQSIVLHGANEIFALNGAGTSMPAGTQIDCDLFWTEE